MAPADQRWLSGLDLLQHARIFVSYSQQPHVSAYCTIPRAVGIVGMWAARRQVV